MAEKLSKGDRVRLENSIISPIKTLDGKNGKGNVEVFHSNALVPPDSLYKVIDEPILMGNAVTLQGSVKVKDFKGEDERREGLVFQVSVDILRKDTMRTLVGKLGDKLRGA
jgi:hypothetical protein